MDESAEIVKKASGIILASISEGVFTVDRDWPITSFSRAAEEITGTPRREAIGRCCGEFFRSSMSKGPCGLRRTMEEGRSCISSATSIINFCRMKSQIVPVTSRAAVPTARTTR